MITFAEVRLNSSWLIPLKLNYYCSCMKYVSYSRHILLIINVVIVGGESRFLSCGKSLEEYEFGLWAAACADPTDVSPFVSR